MLIADFGIRQITIDAKTIAPNVGLGEDRLGEDDTLAQYIEKQKKLIGGHLQKAKFAGPQVLPFPGTEEAYLFFVRHNLDAAVGMVHAQTYVRVENWLGIITLTTPETQLGQSGLTTTVL